MANQHEDRRPPTGIAAGLSGLSLDIKHGFRMVAKHPGITVLAGLAMAIAIGICTATFELTTQLTRPDLGLVSGDRLVAIRIWEGTTSRPRPPYLHEYVTCRDEIESIQNVGGFREVDRNLVTPGGFAEPVAMAEISATALQTAGVAPLLGRLLLEDDERAGAPDVAVIGYDLWQKGFEADPEVVGRVVRIGEEEVAVVGVMPEGFSFPLNHSLWMPFHAPVTNPPLSAGSIVWTFGRLAPGTSLETAQAELSTLMSRVAPVSPEGGEQLRSQIVSYSQAFLDFSSTSAYSVNLSVLVFLLLMCANVALLLFVRVATRESEMVVRTALGATRRRIIAQLVAEALALATLSLLVGLAMAAVGIEEGIEAFELIDGDKLPFWVNGELSLRSIVYAATLAVLCAVISGVLPALNATSGGVRARLSEWGISGTTMRLGRIWSITIIAQVALVVAYVPIFMRFGLDTHKIRTTQLGIDASEYLVAHVEMGERMGVPWDTVPGSSTLLLTAFSGLKERLRAEPEIADVAFASSLPGDVDDHRWRLDVRGGTSYEGPARVHRTQVDLDYFDALGMRILAGRGFHSGDLQSGAGTVIVNESFAQKVLGGRNPIGEWIRYQEPRIVLAGIEVPDQEPQPWLEIVGVVSDVRISLDPNSPDNVGVYNPAQPRPPLQNELSTPGLNQVVIRMKGDPTTFTPRIRSIAAEVDPSLRVSDVKVLDDIRHDLLRAYSAWLQLAFFAGGVAALLAVSGVFSIMSFTVSRRTREIGIRLALGATGWHVVSAVFSRAIGQVGLGVAAGGVILGVFERLSLSTLTGLPLIAASLMLLLGAGVAACAVPVRRALRIQPAEAIKAGG